MRNAIAAGSPAPYSGGRAHDAPKMAYRGLINWGGWYLISTFPIFHHSRRLRSLVFSTFGTDAYDIYPFSNSLDPPRGMTSLLERGCHTPPARLYRFAKGASNTVCCHH